MFINKTTRASFLTLILLSCTSIPSYVDAADDSVYTTQAKSANRTLMEQALSEVSEFVDSFLSFSQDRLENARENLTLCEDLSRMGSNPIVLTNSALRTIPLDVIRSHIPIYQGRVRSSTQNENTARCFKDAIMEFSSPAVINGTDSNYEDKMATLFGDFLDGRISLLVSRYLSKMSNPRLSPSTKLEDRSSLNANSFETAIASCTILESMTEPLAILYRALKAVSGYDDPGHLLTYRIRGLINASPTLYDYLSGGNIPQDPDTCLADIKHLDEFDKELIPGIRDAIQGVNKQATSAESTATVSSVNLSRAQRRALEAEQLKIAKKDKAKATAKAQRDAADRVAKERILQAMQKKTQAVKVTAAPASPTPLPVIKKETRTQPATNAYAGDFPSSSSASEPYTPPAPLKPKRWRGDLPTAARTQEEQALDAALKQGREAQRAAAPIEYSSNLTPTLLVNNADLSRGNRFTLDLLCNNRTHPDTISHDDFIDLMEGLGVNVSNNSGGSMVRFSYITSDNTAKSKVMHLHEYLGRNAMKRARLILIYFGFLSD